MLSRAPLTTPSQGSVKLNPNTTGTGPAELPRPPPTIARPLRQLEDESDWLLNQNSSPTPPPQAGFTVPTPKDKLLPEKQTFSTILPPRVRPNDPQKTAQAALELGSSQNTPSAKKTDGLIIDPALFALSLGQSPRVQHGPNQSNNISILPDSTATSSQEQDNDISLDTPALQPTKRKEVSNSPTKEPLPKKIRPANDMAAELQAPLPPPRAMLPPQGQFHAVTTPSGGVEIRHRVSLPHIQQNNNYQQPVPIQNHASVAEYAPMAVPQNFLYLEYLKKQNQHLETQLYNRNYESNRQADEICRANAYAAQAKRCMRKDGEDINHLRMLILYAKNKMEIWEKMLGPLAILESPSDADLRPDSQGNTTTTVANAKTRVVGRVIDDAQEVIKNFGKALKDVHSRPVHQLDETVDTYATFDG
ncbi:hypothetical protein Dda_3566 [Drechslerella dactyloides]|uniref:Uncharacterized protein n=1 Tax=Drechslerella dactyloides TaxID=74499 RepID=A0AAD6NK15_DREDA|nr:hypothetical protein Dda_3566 [Drechslerella dactyloides]